MPELTADRVEIGTVIGGIYEVTRLIGRGGTSVVWAARHRRLSEKEVAIKVLLLHSDSSAEAAARLRHEAQVLSRLNHPNIVQILDFDELASGTPYMILELLHGESLRERLQRSRLQFDSALDIATQIGSALSAAHQLGVVHRDLKPSNIFLCATPAQHAACNRVKVLDFGISTLQGADTLTTLSKIGGTPQYMAPEQIRGDGGAVDARVDIFACGAVLYEMCAGRPAFKGETIPEVAWQVVYEEPAPLHDLAPDVPPAAAQAIGRALEKDPARRFANVAAFVSALTEPSPRTAGSLRGQPPRRETRWLIVAAAALLVCLGAFSISRAPDVFQRLTSRPSAVGERQAAGDKVAVMEFENQRPRDAQSDWYRRALQTAINTELSSVDQIDIVAPELIRRTAADVGLDPIEAARRLGVRRFITGSFAVVGNVMRIDARIVETTNGLQEAAENVEGNQDDFFTLQRKLALAMLGDLRVKLTHAQRASLTGQANAHSDTYRMLLEAEGLTARQPAADTAPEGPQSRALPGQSEPSRLAALFLGIAHAQETPSAAEEAALRVLQEYRRAHEAGNLDQLAALYVSFPENQRRAVLDYAQSIEDLHVEVTDVKIEPRERDILVSYTRRDRFIDKRSGERVSMRVRLTKFLVQEGGKWKFAAED